jgi:cytochrome P450
MRQKTEVDFMAEFALPLPVMIIAELLGIPMQDQLTFREWSNQVILGGASSTDEANPQRDALNSLSNYFSDLIKERRTNPKTDLISDLIQVRDAQSRLSEQELIGTCILLLIAGHETTANLLGNGLLTLLRHPDQFALLKEHPEYLPTAIEEMLRMESPLQQATFRVAGETFQMGEVTFEKGQQLTALIGAANRDPKYFQNPDAFDITRNPNKHIAFGFGIHFCLGASLARTEGLIGFSKVIAQLPNLKLKDESLQWNPNACLRGLSSLRIAA